MNAHDPNFRAIPQNIEAEQALLGALLINNEAFDALPVSLVPGDFFEPLHQRIFEAMSALRDAGRVVNPVTVKTHLPPDVKVGADMTVAQYVARMMSEAVSVVNVPDYARVIMDLAIARSAIAEAEALAAAAYNCHSEAGFGQFAALVDATMSRLLDRVSEAGRASTSLGDAYLSAFDAAAKNDGVIGVPIALPEIAHVLSEKVFEAGNLYGLLSSSGEGKTSLTMQLIHHAVTSGHPVLFLSYDQSPEQCVRQMIAQVEGIGLKQQREPNKLMTAREQEKCILFATELNRQPIEIIRCQREGVGQLLSYARRFVKKKCNGKTPLIVIDHIGKVKPRDPRLSADRLSGEITVELKAFADETKSAVLILNQRNSYGTKRDNPRPIAADLYGGEGAKADYDAILYLYRAEKYKAERVATAASDADWKKINRVFGSEIEGIAEIGVIKSRFGDPTLTERLKFEAKFTRYVSDRWESGELF